MTKVGAWLGLGLVALACGGRAASDDGREPEAGPLAGRGGEWTAGGGNGAAESGAGTAGGGSAAGLPATDGPSRLGPWAFSPSPEGDGRLPDIPEAPVGEPGIGWDLCPGDAVLSGSEGGDGTASRGTDFLVAESTLIQSIEAQRPQVYVYFEPPQAAAALWFDVAWLEGSRVGEVMFWETDALCKPLGEGVLFDLSGLLTGERGAWASACIPLNEARTFSGLSLRVGAAGRVGLDAIRFAASCRE